MRSPGNGSKIIQEALDRFAVDLCHGGYGVILPGILSEHCDVEIHVDFWQCLAILGNREKIIAAEPSENVHNIRQIVKMLVIRAVNNVVDVKLEVILVGIIAVLEST